MDFGLSQEQEMIVRTVREFVERELYPLEAEVERTGVVPREVGRDIQGKVMKLGHLRITIAPSDVMAGAALAISEVEEELGAALE